MATVVDSVPARPGPARLLSETIDRWIWVLTAALLVATVLAGFVPDSIIMVGLVEAGKLPAFPIVLHMHAVLMGSWMLLLLAQTSMVATGNRRYHAKLGVASFVLAPAMVVTGLVLVPTMLGAAWVGLHANNPSLASDATPPQLITAFNVVLYQIKVGILFPTLVGLSLLARHQNPEMHKRLMILATTIPLAAATQRIGWLPSTLPESPLTIDLYPVLPVLPMFAWDLIRLRRVHQAYVVWFGLSLPFVVASYLLWNSPWWLCVVPKILGI